MCDAPSARADSTNGKPITSSTEPRTTRANAGRDHDADRDHRVPPVRPEQAGDHDREHEPGKREHDVDEAHQQRVDLAAEEAGEEAERDAEDEGDRRPRSTPTWSETWAPWMMRASVSRPSSSVPIGCAQLGSWSRVATSSFGSIVQMKRPEERR